MLVNLNHFSPEKIKNSGQCFRVKNFGKTYRFITREHILYLREIENSSFSVSCDKTEWESIWKNYFDLDQNYEIICKLFTESKNENILRAIECARGIRILRQDPWEILITFIISQNKNIPAIAQSVELLSERFGHKIETPYETVNTFPSPQELSRATIEELRACKVGYRDLYILDAIDSVLNGRIELEKISELSTKDLIEALKTIKGVGDKVASCIALFGYARYEAVPKDVWIKRSIREDFGGEDIYNRFGEYAGILQQHVFYMKTRK